MEILTPLDKAGTSSMHYQPVANSTCSFYVDINEATRSQMLKSAVIRREQMVSDGYNLTLDLDHWNGANRNQKPISLPMDLTMDIEIRKAADGEDGNAA